jgi:ABC-type nickel/cobalt efflux system permease component RcnA
MNTTSNILIYADWEPVLRELTAEELAQFTLNLFLWNRGEQPIINTLSLKIIWGIVEPALHKNRKKYDDRCERMATARTNKALISTNQAPISTSQALISTVGKIPSNHNHNHNHKHKNKQNHSHNNKQNQEFNEDAFDELFNS